MGLLQGLAKNPRFLVELLKLATPEVVGLLQQLTKPQFIDLDEGGKYRIIDPRLTYRGKNYSDWISDWFNWFLSADADTRTLGPVVNLRSLGLPKNEGNPDLKGQRTSTDDSSTISSDPNYPKNYVNDANIRIASDRLQIFEDQAVLVPIIIAYEFSGTPYKDWGYLQDFTGLTIDNGDNPPDTHQLTINNVDIVLSGGIDMSDFRFVTPIFNAVIPDVEYGRSIKDFLEVPVVPGNYPAMVEGYFVMLRFTKGTYWIHSWASAPREVTGPYFSELLYEVEVLPKRPARNVITKGQPARNEGLLRRIVQQKEKSGELKRDGTAPHRITKYLEPDVFSIPEKKP